MKRTAEQISAYIKRRNVASIARDIGHDQQTIKKVAIGNFKVLYTTLEKLDRWIDDDIALAQGVDYSVRKDKTREAVSS